MGRKGSINVLTACLTLIPKELMSDSKPVMQIQTNENIKYSENIKYA